MKQYHKDLLTEFKPQLVENVSIGGLLNYLEGKVLTAKLVADIKSKPTDYEKVEELLKILVKRDDKAFDHFCQALTDNGDGHLVSSLLNPSENTSQEKTSRKRGRLHSEDEDERPAPSVSKKIKTPDAKPTISKKDVYERKGDQEDLFVLFNQFTKERTGTVEDQNSLKSFFEDQLKFQYHLFENCSKAVFLRKLNVVAEKIEESVEKGKKYNSFVVAVLSHGNEKGIETCKNGKEGDGKYITMDEICNVFKSSSLPQLKDCPKVFIVQACRGEKTQKGAKDDQPAEVPAIKDIISRLTTPHDADILISYSTTEGYDSNRYNDGTPYIQNLVTILKEFYQQEHLVDMITRLHDVIADMEFGGGDKQMPCMVSTFRKKMYF